MESVSGSPAQGSAAHWVYLNGLRLSSEKIPYFQKSKSLTPNEICLIFLCVFQVFQIIIMQFMEFYKSHPKTEMSGLWPLGPTARYSILFTLKYTMNYNYVKSRNPIPKFPPNTTMAILPQGGKKNVYVICMWCIRLFQGVFIWQYFYPT